MSGAVFGERPDGDSWVTSLRERPQHGMTYEFGDIGSGDDEEEDDLELESDTDGSSEEEEVPRRGGSAAGATAPDMASQPVYGRVRMHSVAARAVEGAGTERRAALLEKGWARRSVVVNGVAPSDHADFEAVSSVCRTLFAAGAEGARAHEEAFFAYLEDNFDDDSGEVRSVDVRDRKVGHFGNWMERTGHGEYVRCAAPSPRDVCGASTHDRGVPLCCRWVTDEETQLQELLPVMSEVVEVEGVVVQPSLPKVPPPVAVLEYAIKRAVGHPSCPKGGDPSYMNGRQYKRRFGKKIGDTMKKGKFGYGAYKNQKYCYVTIEQGLSAIRTYYDEKLRGTSILNPARHPRIEQIQKKMAQKLGRARRHSPEVLQVAYVQAVFETIDLNNTEEVLTAAYEAKNIVSGTRAQDEFLLDWDDVAFHEASDVQRGGATFKPVVSKNNREGTDRPYGVMCPSSCQGGVLRCDDGKWTAKSLCPVHLLQHARVLQARDAGVAVADLEAPVYSECRRIERLPSGATLVRATTGSAADQAPPLVLVVTPEEEVQGLFYDGSLPFTRGERSWRPPPRGVWFEVAGKGYAVHAWATAAGVTWRMRKLLHKANRRAGREVVAATTIASLSSKSHRIAMATLMSHGGAPETATVEQGTWKDARQLYTYVRSYEPLALARCNVSDVVLGQQTWEQAMAAARRMPAVAATASTSARDAEVMVARVVAAAVAEAQGDALAAGGVSAVLPGDAGANGVLAMAQNAQVVHELLQAREVASASAVAPEEEEAVGVDAAEVVAEVAVEVAAEEAAAEPVAEPSAGMFDALLLLPGDEEEEEEEEAEVEAGQATPQAARRPPSVAKMVKKASRLAARAAKLGSTPQARQMAEVAAAAAEAAAVEASRIGGSGTRFVPCHIDRWVGGKVFKRDNIAGDAALRELLDRLDGESFVTTQRALCEAGYCTTRKEIENFRTRMKKAAAAAMAVAADDMDVTLDDVMAWAAQ